MSGEIAVGIDFGTTSTVVAVVRNGIANTIPDISGQKSIPSYICFRNKTNEIKVGTAAKKFEIIDSENTISGFKRLIGRKYLDKEVIKEMKNLSYDIRKEENEEIGINVYFHGKKESYSPQELVNILFGHVKEVLEKKLNSDVKKVVLTVPTTFHHHQRVLIQEAAEKAGFQVLEIMNEPTAAALAYGIDYVQNYEEKKIVVFDMGGGTLDISILNIKNQLIQVLATGGNSQLGGRDFDRKMMSYYQSEFFGKKDKKLTTEESLEFSLAIEEAKTKLSGDTDTLICVKDCDNYDGKYPTTIMRDEFEQVCDEFFTTIRNMLCHLMVESKLELSDIDEVLLIGGSSFIPKLAQCISEFFGNQKIREVNNRTSLVAIGAARRAAYLHDNHNYRSYPEIVDISTFTYNIYVNKTFEVKIGKEELPVEKVVPVTPGKYMIEIFATSPNNDEEELVYTHTEEPVEEGEVIITINNGGVFKSIFKPLPSNFFTSLLEQGKHISTNVVELCYQAKKINFFGEGQKETSTSAESNKKPNSQIEDEHSSVPNCIDHYAVYINRKFHSRVNREEIAKKKRTVFQNSLCPGVYDVEVYYVATNKQEGTKVAYNRLKFSRKSKIEIEFDREGNVFIQRLSG